jgi:hypothetical protein
MGRRADGWPDDERAPDGYLVGGFRKIRKDGIILASGHRWQHDDLLPHVGKMVRYDLVDPFSIEINVYIGAHADGFDVTPYNYVEHHSSFYQNFIRPKCLDATKHSTRAVDNARKKGWNP